jgi:type I restriction-modification system DNA methylase subunit
VHDECTEVINLCIKVWELFMVRLEKDMKNSPAEEIESTFWSMFDILRGKVDMSESYILLLYLSLYKDDLLSKVYTLINGDFAPELAQKFTKEYADKLPDNKKELSKSYDPIIQGLFNSLGKIDEPEIFEIVEKLCYQKTNMLDFRKAEMHQKWKIRMHDFYKVILFRFGS